MVRTASLFSQTLGLIDRFAFHRMAREHKANRFTKRFTAWDHFVTMVFCQLAQAQSLRETCDGLALRVGKTVHLGIQNLAKRSTLAYANEHRPSGFFRDLFAACRRFPARPHRQEAVSLRQRLVSIDSSVITLCLSLFPWAEYTRTKGGVKLHLMLDHDGYWPTYAHLTEAKCHDVHFARTLALPKGSVVVMDRGYVDYELWGRWSRRGDRLRHPTEAQRALRGARKAAGPGEQARSRRDEIIQLTSPRARSTVPTGCAAWWCATPKRCSSWA